jgi:hypothetical protein
MSNKYYILLISITILLSEFISPQTFTASVSNNKVGSDEQFEITFVFSGSDINSLSNFQPPNFKDFVVLSGPNQSSSMQIINGAVSGNRSFLYYIQARSAGKFVISSASINFKNETLRSEPITIEVLKGTTKPKQQQNDQSVSNDEIAENLFIRAIVDKSTLYQGEQLTVVYKLYTRLNIASPQISKLPSYQGFWAEELETSNNISFTRETIDGKVFNVATLKRAALFPTQAGDLSVTPFELKIPVQIQSRRRSNNIFDDFFNDPFFGRSQTVEFNAKSNTVRVKVLPLPNSDKPSFKGAVGNFSMNAVLDKNEIKQNDPITLKITISGTGNLKLIEQPEVNIPNGFETYDPKVNDEINRSSVVSGSKTFEFLIIPRIAGKFEIPSLEFTYFNPQKKSYQTLESEVFKINVLSGSGEYVGGTSISREDVKVLDRDIRYIKLNINDISYHSGYWLFSSSFYAAVLSPLLIALVLFFWKRKEDNLASNLQLFKNVRAQKIAKKRLRQAAKLMKLNKSNEFYDEIANALFGYLQDKFSIEKSEFSLDKAIEVLSIYINESSILDELKLTIQKCDYIRYAPSSVENNDLNEMYNRTSTLIMTLEDKLEGVVL